MRNLAKMGAVVAICLSATMGAWANDRPGPNPPRADRFRPFARVSVPQKPLRFGEVSGLGPKQLKAQVTAHVVANHPFRLEASFRGLSQEAGHVAIPPKQMTVKINGKVVQIGTERVEIASGGSTPGNGVDVPVVIEVGVKGSTVYPAGQYSGNLVLFVR